MFNFFKKKDRHWDHLKIYTQLGSEHTEIILTKGMSEKYVAGQALSLRVIMQKHDGVRSIDVFETDHD